MTEPLGLDALEAVARAATPGPWHQGAHYIGAGGEPYDPDAVVGQASILCDAEHIAAFDPPTVRALITRLREAERERDGARWAAGIVGDVARESSGGWQDAAAELHAAQDRLREAEAVIEEVDDLVARHHLDTTVGQAVFKITGSYYRATNQEGSAS